MKMLKKSLSILLSIVIATSSLTCATSASAAVDFVIPSDPAFEAVSVGTTTVTPNVKIDTKYAVKKADANTGNLMKQVDTTTLANYYSFTPAKTGVYSVTLESAPLYVGYDKVAYDKAGSKIYLTVDEKLELAKKYASTNTGLYHDDILTKVDANENIDSVCMTNVEGKDDFIDGSVVTNSQDVISEDHVLAWKYDAAKKDVVPAKEEKFTIMGNSASMMDEYLVAGKTYYFKVAFPTELLLDTEEVKDSKGDVYVNVVKSKATPSAKVIITATPDEMYVSMYNADTQKVEVPFDFNGAVYDTKTGKYTVKCLIEVKTMTASYNGTATSFTVADEKDGAPVKAFINASQSLTSLTLGKYVETVYSCNTNNLTSVCILNPDMEIYSGMFNPNARIIAPANSLAAYTSTMNGYTVKTFDSELGELLELSGTINELNWSLDIDGVLTFSGTGKIPGWFSEGYLYYTQMNSNGYYKRFYCGNRVKEIVIEDGITGAGYYAFDRCDSVEKITIGDSFKYDSWNNRDLIGSSTLKTINVSDNNRYITAVDNVLYSKNKKQLYKYPSVKEETTFTVPKGVEYIESYAFKNCDNLENIILGKDVNEINYYAFYDCDNLSAIGIQSEFVIAQDAIRYCPNLNTIVLMDGATSTAFYRLKDSMNCENLNVEVDDDSTQFFIRSNSQNKVLYNADATRLYYVISAGSTFQILKSVDKINNRAFEDIDTISAFTVAIGNPSYKAVNGVLFDSYKEHLVKYPSARADESYTIPSGTEFVNKNAFQNIKYLNEVTIPNSVTSLYSSSIQNPEDHYIIKNVNVGSYACNYYTDMNDPDLRVTSFNVRDEMYLDDAINVTYRDYANKQRLVYSFTADESIDYEIKVKSLDSDYYDFALKVYDSTGAKIYSNNRKDGAMVSFEEGQTYYISFNLTGSTDDYSLSIRKYIKDETYKDGIFYHLDAETMTASVIGPISERYKYSIPARVDGYTVTSIEDYAFNYCEFLTRVNLPATIETIGNGAFADCPNLDYVYIDSSNPNFYVDYNEVIYNADMTELVWFPSYIDLTSFDIPSGVTRINGGAFQGNEILESVTIPNTVLTIGECAFSGTKLSHIIIPSSVATVGEYAFAYNNDLEFVTFMSNETTIGDDAFYESTGAIKASLNSKAKTYADKNKIRFIDINAVEGGVGTDSCKHNFVIVSREESSCVHSGLVTYACEYCHTVYTQVIEISSHSFIAEKTEATPNKQGFEKFTCAICGYSYVRNIMPYATDKGALESAIKASYSYHSADYSSGQVESLVDLCSVFESLNYEDVPQTEIDNAVAEILTVQAEMTPYFNINVTAENGIASVEKQTVLKNATVVVEATGNAGYDFVGWYDTDNNIYMSKSNPYSFKASSNVNLKAVFVALNTATLTFANYSGWVAGVQTKTVAQWTLITTIAPLLPAVPYRYGYTNGRWVYDNSNVLSKLKAGENVTLVPEYDSLELEMPEAISSLGNEPVLKLGYSYDEDNKVGSFLMTAGIPNTVKIEAVGVAFYYHSATSFDPTDNFNLLLNNKLLVSQFNVDEPQEQYIVNINNLSSKYNWAARGYITYTIDDETKTVYSNQINIIDRHQV